MHAGFAPLHPMANADRVDMRAVPLLLLLMTAVAGAIIVLAFQHWVDLGITKLRGTDAEAATGMSDGWFVVGLAAAAVLLIGGVLFSPRVGPAVLPLIALASIGILVIAGFDTITNWEASGVHPDNPGIFVQSSGDPTIVPYVIAGLAVIIAMLAAIVRAMQLRQDPTCSESSSNTKSRMRLPTLRTRISPRRASSRAFRP